MAQSGESKFCIYTRDDEYSMSRDRQMDIINQWSNTLTHNSFFIEDHGSSRDGASSIVERVRDEGADYLVVARLDRLDGVSSTVGEFIAFLSPLIQMGIRFISVEDGLDTDQSAATFLVKLETAVLRARELVRGENIHFALKESKDKGQRLGRPRSVSYEEVLVLRKQGLSIQAIAEKLGVTRGAVQHCLKISPDLSPT